MRSAGAHLPRNYPPICRSGSLTHNNPECLASSVHAWLYRNIIYSVHTPMHSNTLQIYFINDIVEPCYKWNLLRSITHPFLCKEGSLTPHVLPHYCMEIVFLINPLI